MSREIQVRFCESRAVRSRPATHLVVLVHGTRSEAEAIKAEIGELLARRLKMTLSDEKTHITHIDNGFVFLGFHIQRRSCSLQAAPSDLETAAAPLLRG
jgi:hypothetical protein